MKIDVHHHHHHHTSSGNKKGRQFEEDSFATERSIKSYSWDRCFDYNRLC